MITFKQFITESRSAPLYHGTTGHSAADIIKSNSISAYTTHHIGATNTRKIRGVSLSRSYQFAKSYKGDSTSLWVVFEIDQRTLSYTNKIVPINYWNSDRTTDRLGVARKPDLTPSDKRYNEFEEFVIGDIANLDRVLTRIHINPKMMGRGLYDKIIEDHKKLFVKGAYVND